MAHTPNQYKCDSCGFVYLPSQFEGLDLDDQGPDFECPECQAGRDHFQGLVPTDSDIVEPELRTPGEEFDPTGPRLMYTHGGNPNVASLVQRYQKKKLDPQPFFQRYQVWSKQKNSKLIESILLDLPIPLVYLAQESSGKSVVIDGQQRLMAIFSYIANGYSLSGVAKKLNGKKYQDLHEELQDRIDEYQLRTVEILKESDPEVKFLLFQRLNEGSTSLNDQELRNCVHRGSYNDYLKELAKDAGWRKLLKVKGDSPHPRMVDVELLLRYMAFRDQKYMNHPDKKTGQFLDKQMVLGESYSQKELDNAKTSFRASVELATSIFGDHACRRFVPDKKGGKWDSKINRALMDVQLWGFDRHPKGAYYANKDDLRDRAIDLMCDAEFVDLISHTISETKRVERRFDLWKMMIDDTLKDADQGDRLFSLETKKELFENDPTCAICKNSIVSLDDCSVDHILPHSKGGKTEADNAQLAHRYCNKSKSAKV